MADDDVFAEVIEALATATAAAAATGCHGVAYATIELQYVITSRIRPWFGTETLRLSNYTVLEYTVKALETEIAAIGPITKRFTCSDDWRDCMAAAATPADKTLCLMRYAACVGATFSAYAAQRAEAGAAET